MKKAVFVCVVVLGVATLFGQPAQKPASARDLKFGALTFNPPRAETATLSNGMRVVLLEDHELPTIDAFAMVRTGSIYDPPDKIGLAALTGEVMRSGGTRTRKPKELNEQLEFIAASVETGISRDSGTAGMSVLKKDFEQGLEVFADVLINPGFDPEQVALAKSQALELIRRRNDDPGQVTSREFNQAVYGKSHPRAREAETAHIERITRDDMIEFHRRYFYPNSVILGVAGDFQKADLLARLEKVFAAWKPQAVELPSVEPVRPNFERAVYFVPRDINQTHLRLGHLGIKIDNPDFFALSVANSILGGGFSSRLFNNVRTKMGLAYAVGSSARAGMSDPGVIFAMAQTESTSTGKTLEAILNEIKLLQSGLVTAEELAIAKETELNSFVFEFSSPAQIVNRQVQYAYYGLSPDFLERYRDNIARVTAADIQRVARQYFKPDQAIILAVGKEGDVVPVLDKYGKVVRIDLK